MNTKQTELTKREQAMLDLLSKGKSDREIAPKVKLTYATTRLYLHRLYQKIGVTNRTAASTWWLTKGSKLKGPANGRKASAGNTR